MNVFLEHILPGSCMFLFGIFLTLQTIRLYLKSLTPQRGTFQCQISYPVNIKRRSVDILAVLLVLTGIVGMTTQGSHAYANGHFDITSVQHITMYFFFGLCGTMKVFHRWLSKALPLLDQLEYISLALAFVAQALLFKFHLMERDTLDTTIHTLLLYSAYACIVITLSEMTWRNQVLFSLGRGYLVTLQGSWLWQIAVILDNPVPHSAPWKHEDREDIMLATCMFTWHAAVIFLLFLIATASFSCFYKKTMGLRNLEATQNGYTAIIDKEDVETALLTTENFMEEIQ